MQEVSVQIESLNKKGRGIGRYETNKVEVLGALAAETVRVKLGKKRRKVIQGELLQVLNPSEHRVPYACIHAPSCGGCTFQQLAYEKQLQKKKELIDELFLPLSLTLPNPILKAESLFFYRNKMEFTFSQDKKGEKFLGLILAQTRGHVFPLTECRLAPIWMASLLCKIRSFWQESALQAYRMDDTGSLRTITMREGKHTKDKLVMLTVSGNPKYALSKKEIALFVETVRSFFSEEEQARLSIFLRIQQIHKGRETQFFELHLFGKDHIEEKLKIQETLFSLKISPTSFFQPNTQQAEKLYGQALLMISCKKQHVLDLFAGTATLGLIFSKIADKVTSIEINPHACFDAEVNKERNKVKNLEILCGDVAEILSKISGSSDFIPPDLIVLDPPRVGLGTKALAILKGLKAPEILYISCNPTTQAADVKELIASGYVVEKIQPVDQFPHTLHIENICLLCLR